jgi:POT family proton-dependent oligopeptide transporter
MLTVDNNLLKQPKALSILFGSEFLIRFSHWGIQSLLIFYLTEKLLLSQDHSYLIYGAFTSLTFALSILGGVMADEVFGFKRAAILGFIFSCIGNLVLLMPTENLLFFGLALISYGNGLFLPNNPNLLGDFYQKDDIRRDKGFTIYYMATNSGCLAGPIIYGFLAAKFGWHIAFLSSLIGMGLWLLLFISKSSEFSGKGDRPTDISWKLLSKHSFLMLSVASFLLILIAAYLIKNPRFTGYILDAIGFITLIAVIVYAFMQPINDRKNILFILCLMAYSIIFFATAFQVGSSLLVFANQYVDAQIFSFKVPGSMYAALEPAFVVLFAPVMVKIWNMLKISDSIPATFYKMSIGLLVASGGFGLYALSASYSMHGSNAPLIVFTGGFLLLAIGELCIMPILISTITNLAPAKIKSTLMGALYLSLAFSAFISSLIATLTDKDLSSSPNSPQDYYYIYEYIFHFSMICAFVAPVVMVIFKMFKKYSVKAVE